VPPADLIFLDANAGIPARPEVLETFLRVAREFPANPASLHTPGRRAQGVLEDAREQVAALLGRRPREVVFTSGATEGCNLALLGAARARRRLEGEPCPLVASRAEHPAVLGPLRLLQQEGHPLRLVPLDRHARVPVAALQEAAGELAPGVLALQWANNETGAIQDLPAALPLARGGWHLHCDAAQGVGKVPWPESLAGFHTVAFSGHKFGAPKGFGVLVVAEEALLDPPFAGGGQQRGLRPGTESPAGAAALAHALELAFREQEAFARRARAATRLLLEELRAGIPGLGENHPPEEAARLPNTLNLRLPGVDGRALLPACDAEGLAVASGSACASGSALPSPVLLACGLAQDDARTSLRLSLGPEVGGGLVREAARRLLRLHARLYELANR